MKSSIKRHPLKVLGIGLTAAALGLLSVDTATAQGRGNRGGDGGGRSSARSGGGGGGSSARSGGGGGRSSGGSISRGGGSPSRGGSSVSRGSSGRSGGSSRPSISSGGSSRSSISRGGSSARSSSPSRSTPSISRTPSTRSPSVSRTPSSRTLGSSGDNARSRQSVRSPATANVPSARSQSSASSDVRNRANTDARARVNANTQARNRDEISRNLSQQARRDANERTRVLRPDNNLPTSPNADRVARERDRNRDGDGRDRNRDNDARDRTIPTSPNQDRIARERDRDRDGRDRDRDHDRDRDRDRDRWDRDGRGRNWWSNNNWRYGNRRWYNGRYSYYNPSLGWFYWALRPGYNTYYPYFYGTRTWGSYPYYGSGIPDSYYVGGNNYYNDTTVYSTPAVEPAALGVTFAQTAVGVTVDRVIPGSPADVAGLRPGDVISSVNGAPVASYDEVIAMVNASQPGDSMQFELTSTDGQFVAEAVLVPRSQLY